MAKQTENNWKTQGEAFVPDAALLPAQEAELKPGVYFSRTTKNPDVGAKYVDGFVVVPDQGLEKSTAVRQKWRSADLVAAEEVIQQWMQKRYPNPQYRPYTTRATGTGKPLDPQYSGLNR